jgi:hypothetical protein
MSENNLEVIIHNYYADNIYKILVSRITDILTKYEIPYKFRRYESKTLFSQKFLVEAVYLDLPLHNKILEENILDSRKFYFCYSNTLEKLSEAELKYGSDMFYYAEDFNTYLNQLQMAAEIGNSIDYLNNGLSDSVSLSKSAPLRKNRITSELKKLENELLHGNYFGYLVEKKLKILTNPLSIEEKFSDMVIELLSLSKTLCPEIRMRAKIQHLKKFLANLLVSEENLGNMDEIPETGNKKIDAYIGIFNSMRFVQS